MRALALCLWFAAAGSGLALAACGDDGRLDRDQLVEQANEICREQTTSFEEIQAQPPRNAHEGVEQTTELISVAEDALERFEELQPPEDLEGRLDAYLDARRRALELLRRGREAAERQDRRAYSAALDRALAETPARRGLARRLGVTDCG
jgi:hypothetical protein